MAVRTRFRRFYECDTEAERSLTWDEDSLIHCLDSDKYYKIFASGYVEVPLDEVIFQSPIPLNKVSISGVKDGTRFLRDDGAWSDIPATAGSRQMLVGDYKFDTSTTMASPGAGKLRMNSATLASVTQVAISVTTNDTLDITLLFQSIQSGDPLYIQDKDDSTKAIRLRVNGTPTNNTTWFQFPVTYVSSVGTLFGNNNVLAVGFSLAGSAAGGSEIINEVPTGAVNGVNTVFTTSTAFTTGKTKVYLNGLRQKLGAGDDYTETSSTQITFSSPPQTGDVIIMDYI